MLLTPFAVSAFSFYQACFILSSTFLNTFQGFLKSSFLIFYFVASFSQRRQIILSNFLSAVKYFFKYFSFLSMLLFCVPSAGAVVLAYITKILSLRQVLYLVQSDTFLFVRKRVLLYLEALSVPHALEFFVFCCFSACLPLDLQ